MPGPRQAPREPELDITEQVRRSADEYGDRLKPATLELTLVLSRAWAEFERASNDELGGVRLSISQFNVLTVLHRARDELTMGGLASAVSVRPTNLTAAVEALRQRKLVRRRVNPADRRSVLVSLTPSGERFLLDFLPGHWLYLEGLFGGLAQSDRVALIRLLRKLLDSLDQSHPRTAGP
jgi:DNA-binding MarR family transcriptional regulator